MKVEKMKGSRRWLSWLPKAALVALLGAAVVFAGCSSDDDDGDGGNTGGGGGSGTSGPTAGGGSGTGTGGGGTDSGNTGGTGSGGSTDQGGDGGNQNDNDDSIYVKEVISLDFEDVTDIATVAASPNASECLSLATDNTNYLLFDNVQEKGSDRSVYLLNAFSELPEGKPYVIEFDAAVRGRHGKKRFSQLAILTGDEPKTNTTTANVVYTDNFLVSLTCGTSGGGSGGTWFINATEKDGDDFVEGTDGTVTLTNEAWNHYKITVDGDTVKLVISGTDTLAEKTLTLPEHSGAAKWFYFNAAGYGTAGGGMLSLDNLIVTTN